MMKMRRTILSVLSVMALAASGAVGTVSAQNGINSRVEVERDYDGSIARAVKSPLDAPVDDSLLNFKLRFDYTTFYSPYKDLYEFSPVMTLGPASEGRVVYPWLYARVAAAYPWTPSADVYITPRLGERFSFGVYFNHDSYWGKVPAAVYSGNAVTYPGQQIKGDRMSNRGGAFFGYRWTKGELRMDASYTGGMYALTPVYGAPSGSAAYNSQDRLRASISVRSTNADPSSFYYKADIGYRYFNNRRGVPEHLADADLSLGATIKGDHRLYVRLGGTFTTVTVGNTSPSRGLWNISPIYTWGKDRWMVRAGLVFSSVYGDCVRKNGSSFMIYPDASVNFEAARNALWLYFKASGDNSLYTRYDLYALNPWMEDSGRAYQSAVPVSLELGLKGLVLDRFSYSLGINYSRTANRLSFMALQYNYSWYQMVNWADSDVLMVTGTLRWKSPSFYAKAELNYRGFSNWKAALMTPAFDVEAVMEYNLKQRLFIRAGCYFRTSSTGWSAVPYTEASVYLVPALVDVGLRVSYAVNPHVLVFLEGNNLANSKIQYFLNYVEPGINIGAGICLKL